MDTAQDSDTKKAPGVNSIPGDKLCQNILFLSDWVKVQEVKGRPGRGIRLYRTPFAGEPAGRQAAPQGPPP